VDTVTYRDGLLEHKQSPIQVLTVAGLEQLLPCYWR